MNAMSPSVALAAADGAVIIKGGRVVTEDGVVDADILSFSSERSL